MRHEAFGAMAAALPERDLSKVILLAGLTGSYLRAHLRGRLSKAQWLKQTVKALTSAPPDRYSNAIHLQVSLQKVQNLARATNESPALLNRLHDILPTLWDDSLGCTHAHYRVSLTRPVPGLDLQWLAHILVKSEIGVETVVTESRPGAELFWEWPLRIGVLPTPAGVALYDNLEHGRYRELYDLRMVSANAMEFDLVLFNGSLAEMVMPLGLWVGALLVLGSAETDHESATKALRSHLYPRVRTGMAALCFVPSEERLPWLMTVIRELSHNAMLDTALSKARLAAERQNEGGSTGIGDLQAPLVFTSERFMQGARIAEAARRIGMAMQAHERADLEVTLDSSPSVSGLAVRRIKDVGNQILQEVPGYEWASERGDALYLARMRRQFEAQVGPIQSMPFAGAGKEMRGPGGYDAQVHRPVPKMASLDRLEGFAMAEPPKDDQVVESAMAADFELMAAAPSPAVENRYVKCDVTQGWPIGESVKQLQPNENYRALIHIGPLRDEALIVADQKLDESLLPPSEQGHDLHIVFCPLSAGSTEESAPPLMYKVHLPKVGDSDMAEFHFASGSEPDKFRARVIVLHRNRIIQTLLLRPPAPGQDLDLETENLVTPFLGLSEIGAAADLAFVINDNPAGVPGITTIASGAASFIEPAGLAHSIDTMKKLLSAMNVGAVGTETKLDDEEMVSLMVDLANHGAAILREIRSQMEIAPYQAAVRVQVVEAVAKAYLPVEFLYSGKAPASNARLCPNAVSALQSGNPLTHQTCAHAKDPAYVCPAAFWGFSKCIERHPFGLTTSHVFSVPRPGMEALEPFKTAVVAASKRVDAADMTGPTGMVTGLRKIANTLRSAKSWKDWQKKVLDAPTPTLLVLLPHSANSPDVTNMPALEIADSWLESSRLDEDYVHPEGSMGPGPMVLLLGCSTALTEIAFLNFVREFKRSGASVVLGTLATIHGKQASSFAMRLLTEMKKQGNGKPFDQTLLKVKQQMLADGEPFVLSLAAYGHSSWLIKS